MLSANENRREISRASRLPARTGDFSYRNTVNRSTDLSAEASAKEETPLPSPFSPQPLFPRPPVYAEATTGRPVRPPALSTAFSPKANS
jgi:hypothetical protein